MIALSLPPSPASDTSAFRKIHAFNRRPAALFPSRIGSFVIVLASIANRRHESESSNHFKLVDADH
jgi:hypothetical protein